MDNKFVVYTVITGDFDRLRQPAVVDPRFDYILFSDTLTESKIGIWSVRPINFDCHDIRIKSRFPKIRPDVVLSDYEASLYIDGNIQITSQSVYDRCLELLKKGVEWAGIKHQSRDCIYDEINAIVGLGWVHDYEVLDWYKYLRDDKYPEHNGLYENNVIFRLHSQTVKRIGAIWWNTLEKQKVKRDQFSLMYSMWKVSGAKVAYILHENENAWHNECSFDCESHKPHSRLLQKSLWEKLRDRYIRMFYWNGGWEVYYTHWFDKLLKWPFPHLMMHLWTAWILTRYDLRFLAGRLRQRWVGRVV